MNFIFDRRKFLSGLAALALVGKRAQVLLPMIESRISQIVGQDQSSITWWDRQGVAFDATQAAEGHNVEEPHVIYESGGQIITSVENVFKMWYGVGGFGAQVNLCYAESIDGLSWTKYSRNPVVTNFRRACVFKSDGIYYLFGADVAASYDHYDVYTSCDGVNFSLAGNNVMAVGSSGEWDSDQLANSFVWTEGSIWYMIYEAKQPGGVWKLGLATTLCPTGTWTKYLANPVVSGIGTRSGPHIYKAANGTYYLWAQYCAIAANAPNEIGLWHSKNLIDWLPLATPYWFRETSDEGVGSSGGQIADTTLVTVGEKSYFYLGSHASQGANGVMKVQTCTATPEDYIKVYCPALLSAIATEFWVSKGQGIVLKFDLNNISTGKIFSARLRLYCDSKLNTDLINLEVFRFLEFYSDFDPIVLAKRSFSSTDSIEAWKEWVLDPLTVQGMIDGTYLNDGFLIKADIETSNAYRFKNDINYLPQLLLLTDKDS